MRTILAITFCLALLLTGSAIAQWTPELQIKTKALGSPRISPDGTKIVYTVSNEVMGADKSEYVAQIWLASTDGKENMQLTFADKSSTNPKWSPDGKWIAFTSTRGNSKSNLYLMRIAGGEAEMITDVKSGVGEFEWSPDGKWIAFSMTDAKSDDEDKNDKGRNDFRWIDENIKVARLYVMPVAKDAAGKREHRRLTTDNRSLTGFDWSPDGSKIAFSHVTDPRADHWPSADLSVVDVASGTVSTLAATTASETNPNYSPDGKWIAFSISDGPVRWAQSNRIAVMPSAGGTPKLMALSHDGQPNILAWNPDSRGVLFTESRGTGTALYGANVDSGAIQLLDHQEAVITAPFSGKDGWYTLIKQTADTPPEVYVGRTGTVALTKVSNANAEAAKLPVGRSEVIKWKSKDGREVEGLLTYPANYQAGTKVPLILNIHGGPAGVFNQSYVGGRGVYPLATLASKGYAILRPNPRGSSGYGTEFRRANIKDWGFGDYEDLMTGVDHVISMGVADPNRLGVMGWSYGGYMTSMIITKTNRFKAASAGAPVTNMMSFNGTADIPSFIPDYFEGEFWDNPAIYSKHSAMFNIKNAKTPTLIQHGEADVRVPISQGYELYNALRRQGVPTRMIVLPRQPHGPNEPKMQLAAMQSNIDWFEKYLK